MSDINRLQPICENCQTQYTLRYLACSGGAAGDVYLCERDYREHAAECEECDDRDGHLGQVLTLAGTANRLD